MKIISTDCDCKQGKPYADGSFPQYFYSAGKKEKPAKQAETAAVEQFILKKVLQIVFWGVHLNNKHIIDIEDHGVDLNQLVKEYLKEQKIKQ